MCYIDEAVVEKVMLTLGPRGRRVLRDGVEAFPDAMTRLCSELKPVVKESVVVIDCSAGFIVSSFISWLYLNAGGVSQ